MAKGINKVILIGNLGNDPEVRDMPNGNRVANVSIATTDSWKDKQTGQTQERTEWHRVVFFGRLVELVGEYLRKGSKVYIEGALRTRKWQNQQGQDQYTTEVVVDMGGQMQMLDSKNDSPFVMDMHIKQTKVPPQNTNRSAGQQAFIEKNNAQQTAPKHDDFDDDIPF